MEKGKSQIILLDKNELETVAKALSSTCWTLTESGNLEIAGTIADSSSSRGGAPQLTLAQGNVRPVTQVSVTGGTANSRSPIPPERSPTFQRDNSQVTTLNELGKKLLAAAKVGNTSQVRRLMAIGAPFASDGPIGMTPLHLASQNGHYETCDRLLAAGMNKDARNKVEKTPLHLAAMEGHKDIVSLLVKSGANVNACDMLKMTALHWACDRGHTSIVGLLLKHHAKTDLLNKFSKPPLHLAVERGHQQIVRMLQDGVNYKEEEEAVAVESISLNVTDDLNSIPIVCKTEEVCTEEYEEEVEESQAERKEKERFSMEGDLPHSILADDSDDQNISVLATLAELAEATSKGSEGNEDVASADALELLKAQAALLPLDDSSTLVTTAVAHGQTLHLTEAGRQALKLIKQEIPLLPTTTIKQEHLTTLKQEHLTTIKQEHLSPGHNKSAKVTNSSNSQRNRNKASNSTSYSSSSSETHCLPALLSTTGVETIAEEIAEEIEEESQQVTQVITLSPEQYAALTGETNGPIILQVLSGTEEQLNELDTGQAVPPPKRQKMMQLVTRTGQGLSSQNQAVAKVSGQVISVDVSRRNHM